MDAGKAQGIDCCDLVELPPGALLRDASTSGFRQRHLVGETCPVLPAEVTAIPALQQRKLRMNRNRAARLGGWGVDYACSETTCSMLEAMVRMNAARWGACDPAALAFHRHAVPALAKAGL